MLDKWLFSQSLNARLIIIMLFLSSVMITILLFIYSSSEKELFQKLEQQTLELTKAIQIGVEEMTSSGGTDKDRLANYLRQQSAKGIKEISIIDNSNEVLASTNPEKTGQKLTYRKKELIIKAELGEPVSEEGRTYNVILPVIADNVQYGYIHLKINKDDFSEMLKANTIKRILATLFVFGLGTVLALLLARHYTKPISELALAANKVAEGDLNQKITVKSFDEIGQLSRNFNHMIAKLKENKALEERLREAEHLSSVGQLSQTMAHEIRNPLNFINLSVEYIESKYRPSDKELQQKFDELINGIKQEIQRLNKLVKEFLDYSRPMRLNLSVTNMNALIDEALSFVWAKAEADGVEIIKDYCSEVSLQIDPDLFKSCLLNIFSNALYAMSDVERKRILIIKTQVIDEHYCIIISDNGHGIAPKDLDRIFEPFFTTKPDGLGIGLALTKRVVEEHKGTITFKSTLNEGTEVTIKLPLQRYN